MFTNLSSHKQLFQLLALTLCVFAFVGMIMVNSTTVAFCTDDTDTTEEVAETIQGSVSGLTSQIYNIMRAVIVPFCIVALAAAGFQFLVGGSQGGEKARKIVIGVVAAIAFIVFAPLVVKTVAGMAAESGTSDWDGYNPLK